MHARNGSLLAFFTLLVLCGCGGGGSSGGNGGDGGEDPPPGGIDPPLALLAGGGRAEDSSEPAGGAAGSGPVSPLFDPYPGPIVLFASDLDCHAASGELVLRTTAAWQAWWDVAISCLPFEPFVPPEVELPPEPPTGGGGDPGTGASGGGVAVPGDPSSAPEVDFTTDSIVVIALDPALVVGRGLWVSEVVDGAGGVVIVRYEVTTPALDCAPYLGEALDPSSPVVAVQVPRVLDGTVVFERTDSIFSCDWAPDPSEPVTLYYTDGDCALGADRIIIRDTATFVAWLDEAQRCDAARWFDPGQTEPPGAGTEEPEPPIGGGGGAGDPGSAPGDPGSGSGSGEPEDPGVPTPVPGGWLGLDVDFTTHAVLVLRAGVQTRWGGGVWLNSIDASASGTTIEYTVMTPGILCPEVEPGLVLRPTVAIRVPLPLDEPVVWIEHVDSISCDWGEPVPLGAPGTTTADSPGQ